MLHSTNAEINGNVEGVFGAKLLHCLIFVYLLERRFAGCQRQGWRESALTGVRWNENRPRRQGELY